MNKVTFNAIVEDLHIAKLYRMGFLYRGSVKDESGVMRNVAFFTSCPVDCLPGDEVRITGRTPLNPKTNLIIVSEISEAV